MSQIGLFVVFNSFLPFTDIGTDAYTSWDLFKAGHINWALLTFYLFWNSFILHLFEFFLWSTQAWWNEDKDYAWRKELKKVAIALPFVYPIKHLHDAQGLRKMGFGTKRFDQKNSRKVEKIKREAVLLSIQESFTEAGPQTVVTLVKLFSTGSISNAQVISLVFSFSSLALSSAKAFFILRTQDESDPDPDIKMLLLRIVPRDLLIVTNSAILWAVAGGLLGPYIVFGLVFNFLVTLGALYLLDKRNHKVFNAGRSQEGFKFQGALTSVWLASVVGHPKSNYFLTASITSLVSKVLLLLFAILLSRTGSIYRRPILTECRDQSDINQDVKPLYGPFLPGFEMSIVSGVHMFKPFKNSSCFVTTDTFYQKQEEYPNVTPDICFCKASAEDFNSCFHDVGLVKKVRICEDWFAELLLEVLVALLLTISTAHAAMAIKYLHEVSDNTKLFDLTKTFLYCFSTTPILHRSYIFQLLKEGDHRQLESILDTCRSRPSGVKQVENIVNRANYEGETPLHCSTRKSKTECTKLLLISGALPMANCDGKFPDIGPQLNNEEVVKKLMEAKQKNQLSRDCLRGLAGQANERKSAQLSALLSLEEGGDIQTTL